MSQMKVLIENGDISSRAGIGGGYHPATAHIPDTKGEVLCLLIS
jgi:hypothetical protein